MSAAASVAENVLRHAPPGRGGVQTRFTIGRTGKQYPRMGKMFANWLTKDTLLSMMKNWPKFSDGVLGGKPVYIQQCAS
jgi:hypothetical protein